MSGMHAARPERLVGCALTLSVCRCAGCLCNALACNQPELQLAVLLPLSLVQQPERHVDKAATAAGHQIKP